MIGDRDLPRPETDWRLYHHDPGHASRHVSPQSRGPGYLSPESFHSDAADMDNSGRYRSYKDSSGDQGEVLMMCAGEYYDDDRELFARQFETRHDE